MFKLRWYLLIGILGYLSFVIANIPANFVLKQVPSISKQKDFLIEGVSGSVWSGAGSIVVKSKGKKLAPVTVKWNLQVWKLLMAKMGLHYEVEGLGFKLAGDASISPTTVIISDTNGHLNAELINTITKPEGVEIDGLVELIELNLKIDFIEKRAEAATGRIYWGGGGLTYKQGRSEQNIEFPAVNGVFSEKEGSLGLTFTDEKNGKVIATGEVAPTGWAKVAVMNYVLELAGMNPGKSGGKPVFEVKQKLF